MIRSQFKKFLVVLSMIGVLSLIGCQKKWEFSIINTDDPSSPEFCLSTYPNCVGDGVSFSVFDIFEVDTQRRPLNKMWVIQPKSNSTLRKMKYGEVPEGWEEVFPAKSLKLNTLYMVHGYYYFRIIQEGDKIIAEKYSILENDRN